MVITSGNIPGWCYDPCIRWIRVCDVCYTYRSRTDINKAIYHNSHIAKNLETRLGSMDQRPEKKMKELVQRPNKAKGRVCTTYTKNYFTCSATPLQTSEGINPVLKHRGLFKADLKKFNLYTPQAHLVVYHVGFHGTTSHMEIHVVKVDELNRGKPYGFIMKPKRDGIPNLNRIKSKMA